MSIGSIIKTVGRLVKSLPKLVGYGKTALLVIKILIEAIKPKSNRKESVTMGTEAGKAALEVVIRSAVEAVLQAKSVINEFPEMTRDEVEQIIRTTLDNTVGSEADAVLGPDGKIKLEIIPGAVLEGGSDLLFEYLAPVIARWLKPAN